MSRLDSFLETHPLPTWRRVAWPVMVLLTAFVVWAEFGRLDEVAVASGEVVPQGKLKVVQHLEGGIVEDIFVKEGDTVREGTRLIQLNLATGSGNRNELMVREDAQVLIKTRLEAQAKGTKLEFPADIAKRQPALVSAQQQAYESQVRQHESAQRVLQSQKAQREQEVKEMEAKQAVHTRNLSLGKERLKLSESLRKDKLVPEQEHLKLEAEVESLEGELQTIRASIPRARASVNEIDAKLQDERNKFRREAQDQLAEAEQAIARLSQLLNEASEQKGRSEVKSPIDGIVKNLRYNTIGGVVKPGDPIMEIVPADENLIIEAKLNPTDRGYVEAGQKAVVKISTYDYARYGGLDGEVIMVAPDSTTEENGNVYFRVRVRPEKTYLGERPGMYGITPGMQATVDIHTGDKSIRDYLVKPVLKLRYEAFRER